MIDSKIPSKYVYPPAGHILRQTAGRILRKVVQTALEPQLFTLERTLDRLAVQHGQSMSWRNAERNDLKFNDAEFSIFSQWGEDGIVQYLIKRTQLGERSFVECGVGDYTEANTRFLLVNDNWRGLIIDGDSSHVSFLSRSALAWRHDIASLALFVTAENINSALRTHDMIGDVGLLSIDIDGNDYWILKAITEIQPRIIICEYNSVFGCRRAVSIPYDPHFKCANAHYSHLYFGASLAAFDYLLSARGYILVGCESHGANAFFVRSDVAQELHPLTPAAAYVASRFRNSRVRISVIPYTQFGVFEREVSEAA
ncbi:MAG: FkbM family methyltransferase [Acidimicrobiales bacterium]